MPDKQEIERRKQIARDLQIKAQLEFERGLPTSRANFKALFDYLDEQLSKKGCDHTLRISVEFLQISKIDNVEEVTEWLNENDGCCDCEILANVEEKFE